MSENLSEEVRPDGAHRADGEASIETPCLRYQEDEVSRRPSRVLYYGGTEGMRTAGEEFIPREVNEPLAEYEARLKRSALFNVFALTVEDLTGKVFSEKVCLDQNAPEWAREFEKDVDLAGNSMHVFSRERFIDAVVEGLSLIMVDYSGDIVAYDSDGNTRPLNRAEERLLKRPRWCSYGVEQLIWWDYETTGSGQWRLTEARLKVERVEPVAPWGERVVQEIKQYFCGDKMLPINDPNRYASWQLWRKIKYQKSGEEWWVPIGGRQSMRPHFDIPLVPIYTSRTSFFRARPGLPTLAELNCQHWFKQSDYDNGLHTASIPMWHRAGCTQKEAESQVSVGYGRMYYSTNVQAHMECVEHSGQAFGALRTSIIDLEEQMRQAARVPLKPASGDLTATSDKLRFEAANCTLAAWALGLKDGLDMCWYLTGIWLNKSDAPEVIVRTDYEVVQVDQARVQSLATARASKDIARRFYLKALLEEGVMPEDFSEAENDDLLLQEMEDELDSQLATQAAFDSQSSDFSNQNDANGSQSNDASGDAAPSVAAARRRAIRGAHRRSRGDTPSPGHRRLPAGTDTLIQRAPDGTFA